MKAFAELSFEQLRGLVQDALESRYGMTGEYGGARAWVCEMYDGYAIVQMDGKTYRCDYTVAGTDVTIGELAEVVTEYVPAGDVAMAGLNGEWIEVFRAGDYGKKGAYSESDLDAMIANYDPKTFEAPVVVGHPEIDSPAFGWVESLKRDGDTLLAKLKSVPVEFEELVKAGRYKKRSIKFATEPKLALRHVGFLGAAPPEVQGLADAAFRAGEDEKQKYQSFEFKKEDGVDTLEMKKTFREELRSIFAPIFGGNPRPVEAKQFSEDELNKKVDERTAELKKSVETLTTQFNEQKQTVLVSAQSAKASDLVAALKSKGKWIPAFDKMGAPAIFAALAASEQTVEFGEGDKKAAKPVAQVFADFLEGLGEIVPSKELTAGAKRASNVVAFTEAKGIGLDQDSVNIREFAVKIADERKIDFGEALKIARREVGSRAGDAAAGAV
jgi:hypothetical protein